MKAPRAEKKSSRHVAFLRGINVGGKNMLPMKELASLFAHAGCTDVTTYIQSGNVLFTANDAVVAQQAAEIAYQIDARFGLRVPVVLRSAAELTVAVQNNPFRRAGAAEDRLHVYFLAGRPDAAEVAALDASRSAPDAFAVVGREVYLQLPNGMARTKLTNAYFDSKLRTVSTARNWRTVLKLAELLNQQSPSSQQGDKHLTAGRRSAR
jgi:uncharacterized protein (DUF1697 family)